MRYRLPKSPILQVDFIEPKLEVAFDNRCNFSEALLIEGKMRYVEKYPVPQHLGKNSRVADRICLNS